MKINQMGIIGAVAAGALAASMASAEAPATVSVGGFVGAGYDWTHVKDATSGNGGSFGFNEGALWISGTSGQTKGVIDLPVYGDSEGTDGLSVGLTKAQAYVETKYSNGFSWKLGQFDGLFGSEGKYKASIPFAKHSHITNVFFPWVHTGIAATYGIDSDWAVDLLVANKTGTAHTTDGKLEYGLKVGGKLPDAFITEISGALYTRSAVKGFLQGSGVLEFTFGDLVLRGDGLFSKPAEGADTQLAMGGYALYSLDSELSAGLRFGVERGTTEKFEITVGPQYKLSKNLTAKVDYTLEKGNPTGTTHNAALSGVYKF